MDGAAGFEDSRAQSLAYLRSLSNGMAIDAMLEAFVDGTWMPVIKIPGELQYGQQKVVIILRERSLPGGAAPTNTFGSKKVYKEAR